jgi:UDP-glucose 4-epimerase
MKKILITGSSGYIGLHLCKLLGNSYHITGLDRVFKPQYSDKFIQQSVLENKDVEGEYDTVIHLAGLVQVGGSFLAPMDYYRTNILGTLNMLERVNYKNFIFASTGTVITPTNPYSLSKMNAETLVKQYCELNNKCHTIFRFYNVTGYAGYSPTNPDGLFFNLMKAVETGEFNLYGNQYDTRDGTAIRDYIHVLEICNAIKFAIDNPSCVPGAETQPLVENLGSGQGYTVMEIIDAFKRSNYVNFNVNILPARIGDVAVSKLENVSLYMRKMFTLDEMMKI